MKSKKEMKEAMDQGKILIDKYGDLAYLDYSSGKATPYVFKTSTGHVENLIRAWEHFENFEIIGESEKITNPWKLKAKISEMLKDGIPFYVRYAKGPWELPSMFRYGKNCTDFEWIEFDPETGIPIGEPMKFLED